MLSRALARGRGERCALLRPPLLVVSIEKSADHQIGFLGAAMVRTPVKAFQIRVGRHGCHVVTISADCERRNSR